MYAKDSKGKIPKKNDHLIDCYRYFIDASNYDFASVQEFIKRREPVEEGRYRRYKDEDMEIDMGEDWTNNFGDEFDFDI